MKIKQINYNWFASPENGEEYTTKEVGKTYGEVGTLININEHSAAGEGDKWYYDLVFDSGKKIRVFNPNAVFFAE